ncbi:hypothetical protein CNMCM5793_004372 [Aspergillus hiratsukae]|uniref:Uncharacterized protein n=1 Tax=Aspergillus hiratsukae TaxID=1194566 RepID=A0A8H6PFQ8_9EURO|nr:hypothetical protein CNMCM5793_004372 [Aspergillus hiratsukae]
MSRNFIPAALAIGMGILTGYYTFQPALQELQTEKRKPQSTSGQAEQSGDSQTKPQTPASNSETKPSDQTR